jgi:N-methylhydantoinase B
MARSGGVDPILLEVLWNRLVAVVNEQAAALMRTSFTSIVRESGDLSAGVFDPEGRMIAQAVTGTPGHINSMATCIHHFLDEYPVDVLRPGDVLVTNDPWKTSGHLHDLTVVTPIFRDGALVAFFGNTCHAIDIGGRGYGADATEVYEEGLFIPITKVFDRGAPNEELFKFVRANVRVPDQVLGDLHAQVACNDVGGSRLLEFMREFGFDSIQPLSDEIVERSERAMREAIRRVPNGIYENEAYSDGFDEPTRLKVRVEVMDDEVLVDYAGTSPQSRYGINVVHNYTHAYTTYAIKCAISPEVPNNEGSFRPVKVVAPEGSILNAKRPAPVAARHILGHFLPGVVFGALRQAVPGRVMAEGAANIWSVQHTGYDPRRDARFTYVFFTAGGTGARPGKDGLSNTAFPSGIMGVSTEVVESLSPVLIRKKEMRVDSGGPGRFRGGLGQTLVTRVCTDRPYTLSGMFDRTRFPAQGYEGGREGARGEVILSTGERPHPKQTLFLSADTEVTFGLPGGGGFHNPFERPVGMVLEDVLDGLVSVESAGRDYGVAIDLDAGLVDIHETERLRGCHSELSSGELAPRGEP